MIFNEEGCLLRIFIGESDHRDGMPLYSWLVKRAKQDGLSGATVLKGIEGYGAEGLVHTARVLQLSTDLPIIVEILDSLEKIEKFVPILDEIMVDGVATIERIFMKRYSSL